MRSLITIQLLIIPLLFSNVVQSTEKKCQGSFCDISYHLHLVSAVTELEDYDMDTYSSPPEKYEEMYKVLIEMGNVTEGGASEPSALVAYLTKYGKLIEEMLNTKIEEMFERERRRVAKEFSDHSIQLSELHTKAKFNHSVKQGDVQASNERRIVDDLKKKQGTLSIRISNDIRQLTRVIFMELIHRIDVEQTMTHQEWDKVTNQTDESDNETSIQILEPEILSGNLTGETFNESLTQVLKPEIVMQNQTIIPDDNTLNLTLDYEEEELLITEKDIGLNVVKPADCLDILKAGYTASGVYKIYPQDLVLEVYCDMVTHGGGWTTFLYRQKQEIQLNFERSWQDYKHGFGEASDEHWLGNEALHVMTNSKNYSIRLDAYGNGSPTNIWGEYSVFEIKSEADKYRLTICEHNKNSTLHNYAFLFSSGSYFSTVDTDNDNWVSGSCSQYDEGGKGGGFWYPMWCGEIYPTRPYGLVQIDIWSPTDANKRIASSLRLQIRPRSQYD